MPVLLSCMDGSNTNQVLKLPVKGIQLLIGGTAIGVGKIVEKTKCFHGILLRDTELKVQVMKVNYDMEHPDYP